MDKLIHVKQSDKGVDDELHRIVQAVNHIADLIVEPSTSRPSDRDKSLMQVMTTENNEYAVAFRTKDGYVCSVPGMFEKSDGLALNINASRSYGGVLSGIEVLQQGLTTVVEISDVLVVKEAARDAKWGHYYPTALADVNSAEGTKLSGIAAGATVGATWGTDLNSIPARISGLSLPEPCVAITENFIGFYQSGTVTDPANWPIAIYNDSGVGKFYLKDTNGGNTTLISAGVTAFATGPTSAPTIVITQAGVLTCDNGTNKKLTLDGGQVNLGPHTGNYPRTNVYNEGLTIQYNSDSPAVPLTVVETTGGSGNYNMLNCSYEINSAGYRISGSSLSYSHVGAAATIHNLIDTTNHPVSGLTTGHFLKALSATTYGFAVHGLVAADVGVAFGSTNASSVYASKTSSGATDDQLMTLGITIGATTYYVLLDQWVT